jgi:hypothetical protein
MGFLDKAKKLAEQAQTKIDEVQKDFNAKQSGGEQDAGPGAQYDEHGRQITPDTSQTAADLPATGSGALDQAVGDPLTGAAPSSEAPPAPTAPPTPTSPDPAPSKVEGDPLGEEAERKPETPPSSGGGLTSGDPLG